MWIASLSRALNDIRTAAEYAVRRDQPAHERLYFVRITASHIREAVKLTAREHDERSDIQGFVAEMPEAGRVALGEIKQRIDAKFEARPDVSLLDEIKRFRNDTLHYGTNTDEDSVVRMRGAMDRVAEEVGSYSLAHRNHRAEYADNITAALTHPFGDTPEETGELATEPHEAIIDLIGPLSTFVKAAETHWLNQRPDGTITWQRA